MRPQSTAYCATFTDVACRIHIEAKPSAAGQVFAAIAFVKGRHAHEVKPIHLKDEYRPLTLMESHEAAALSGMVKYLERILGSLHKAPRPCDEPLSVLVVGDPYELPHQQSPS